MTGEGEGDEDEDGDEDGGGGDGDGDGDDRNNLGEEHHNGKDWRANSTMTPFTKIICPDDVTMSSSRH
jgi:hypothetical protein